MLANYKISVRYSDVLNNLLNEQHRTYKPKIKEVPDPGTPVAGLAF